MPETPEQAKARRERNARCKRESRAAESPEQREARLARNREYNRRHRDRIRADPELYAEYLERMRQACRASYARTPREVMVERNIRKRGQWRARRDARRDADRAAGVRRQGRVPLTPDQHAARRRARRAAETPEQRGARLERERQYQRRYRARKAAERPAREPVTRGGRWRRLIRTGAVTCGPREAVAQATGLRRRPNGRAREEYTITRCRTLVEMVPDVRRVLECRPDPRDGPAWRRWANAVRAEACRWHPQSTADLYWGLLIAERVAHPDVAAARAGQRTDHAAALARFAEHRRVVEALPGARPQAGRVVAGTAAMVAHGAGTAGWLPGMIAGGGRAVISSWAGDRYRKRKAAER